MKEEKLLNIIGDINGDYISEAEPHKRKNKTLWIKWVAVAACFCIILSMGVLNIQKKKPTEVPGIQTTVGAQTTLSEPDYDGENDSELMFYPQIELDGAIYEIIINGSAYIHNSYGIKSKLTETEAGEHIAYMKRDGEGEYSNYTVVSEKTDIELMTYAPANEKAVRIIRDGKNYYAALFCNYIVAADKKMPSKSIFELYGVEKAGDIKSIYRVKANDHNKILGDKVTDEAAIADFYNELLSLKAYSFDEFYKMQFSAIDEAAAQKLHTAYADDFNGIKIETAKGLKFRISYFPNCGWVEGNCNLSYYRASPTLNEWFRINMGI